MSKIVLFSKSYDIICLEVRFMVRVANINDLEDIMQCIYDAREFLHDSGSTQWNGPLGYPSKEIVIKDINDKNAYVIDVDGTVCGFAVYAGFEPEYTNPDAHWQIETDKYMTIHRIATRKFARGKGYAKELMLFAENVAKERGLLAIRIDTHPKNEIVRHMVTELGYKYCGDIIYSYIPIEPLRQTYEKIIK